MAGEDFRDEDESARPLAPTEYRHQLANRDYELRAKELAQRAAEIVNESGAALAERYREIHLIDDERVISGAIDSIAKDLAERRVTLSQLSHNDIYSIAEAAAHKAGTLQREEMQPQYNQMDEQKTEHQPQGRDNTNPEQIPRLPSSRGLDRPADHYAALDRDADRDTQVPATEQVFQRAVGLAGPDAAERQAAPPDGDMRSIDGPRDEILERSRSRDDTTSRERFPGESSGTKAAKEEGKDQNAEKEITDADEIRLGRQAEGPFRDTAHEVSRPMASGHPRGGR